MRRAVRAYTLIEVLVVVSILGLASAVVVPHMLTASTLGIQAAARTVIADLLFAQNEAIVQQRPRYVRFDFIEDRYWLEDENNNPIQLNWRVGGGVDTDGGSGTVFIDFRNDERFTGVRLARVVDGVFQDDGAELVLKYDELGSPDAAAEIGLVANGQKFQISVAAFTGRVKVARVE